MTDQDQENRPDYKRPEVCAIEPDLQLLQDLLGGTRAMHTNATTYIRKWSDEEFATYQIRSTCENVFEGLARTLSAAVGMVSSKLPSIAWNDGEAEIKSHWQNIDGMGTAGHVFTKRFEELAIRDGLGLLLIDHTPRPQPPAGEFRPTAAQAAELSLQPRWRAYGRGNVLNWRTAVQRNQTVFTLIVCREWAEEPQGRYGITKSPRYRVLELKPLALGGPPVAQWSVWKIEKPRDGGKEIAIQVAGGVFRNKNGETRDTLPVRVAYCGRSDGPMSASIPLLGVAYSNLAHWQAATDLRFYRSLCAFPQPTVVGDLQDEVFPDGTSIPGRIRLGPMVCVYLKTDADFRFTELQGTALDQLDKGVKDKLVQIAQQGMSFLLPDTRAAETAEAKRLDATSENATIATAAQGVEDAVNGAFEDHAWYLGIMATSVEGKGAPVITLNRDYESTSLDASVMNAFAALAKTGFPKQIILEAMQRGGRIGEDKDLDDLELEWITNEEAALRASQLEGQLRGAA